MSTATDIEADQALKDAWVGHYRCLYCSRPGSPVAVCGHRMLGVACEPGSPVCKRCLEVFNAHMLGHEVSGG